MGSLRQWTVTEQVGLLFVVLFGALVLASLVGWVLTLREPVDDDDRMRRRRWLRDLRAVWIGALLFWLAWMSGAPGATLLSALLSFLALREYVTLLHTRRGDHRSLLLAFFVALPLQYLLVGLRMFELFAVFVPVVVFLALPVASALAGDPERFLERNATITWGLMVCLYGLSHAPALLLLDPPGAPGRGAFLLFFLVMVVVAAQIGQEAASRHLRSMPAARRIDRSFSWRAFGWGLAAGAIVGAALYWITPLKPWHALMMAVLAAAAGSLGDLVMRALKKDAGVRFWGNTSSITGAVGLLDRIAPIAFAAPVFFHAARWAFGWRA
ncbi:MAG: phosphatidate cytidylyltransferase [Aquabacterium sp.]